MHSSSDLYISQLIAFICIYEYIHIYVHDIIPWFMNKCDHIPRHNCIVDIYVHIFVFVQNMFQTGKRGCRFAKVGSPEHIKASG